MTGVQTCALPIWWGWRDGSAIKSRHCSLPYGDGASKTPAGYYDIYTAAFTLNGVEYEIEAQRLELEEVIKITASIINMPYSEDFVVGNP